MEVVDSVDKFGFVSAPVDPTLDLFAEIERLKQANNAVILAHYYQDPDIQDVADFVGDSLALSQQAAKTDADIIVFAGVHFMAETAKLLSPEKKVLLPDLNAGCSLSESCPAPLFAEFKKKYPDHTVISYINCSAALKALSDIIVTSTNSVPIVRALPKDEPIIFAPDKNLGRYVARESGRDDMVLWNGACMVHEIFSHRKIQALKAQHPEAQLIAHPECEEPVLQLADVVGSTSKLLRTVAQGDRQTYIVATEPGILHAMRKQAPNKTLIPAPAHSSCACNNCPHMKLNTLEKLYLALKYQAPEVTLNEAIAQRARQPIDRMLELSTQLGL